MTINNDLLDQLLADYQKPEDILGENGLLKQLTKAVLERAMQAELTHHLGYPKHDPRGQNSGNSRNGKSRKTLKGDFGSLTIEVPRDRNSSFEPQIVPKGRTRFERFDDKILSLYARGMTTRQIKQHLEEIYQVESRPRSSPQSLTPSRMRLKPGSRAHWMRSTLSSTWTRWW
jgi:putative transposase